MVRSKTSAGKNHQKYAKTWALKGATATAWSCAILNSARVFDLLPDRKVFSCRESQKPRSEEPLS